MPVFTFRVRPYSFAELGMVAFEDRLAGEHSRLFSAGPRTARLYAMQVSCSPAHGGSPAAELSRLALDRRGHCSADQ